MAKTSELPGIAEIDKVVIGNKSRKQYIKEAIKENKCFIAKKGSSIVGFLIYNTNFFECSFIALVIISPSERRKGYAKLLINYFESKSITKKIFSSTNQSNENMQKLFDSIGYIKSGYVENLDDEDPEIVYFKNVNNSAISCSRERSNVDA